MLVVSDTGPIHYLALIEHLDSLPNLYGRVVIPPAVVSELPPQCVTVVRELIASPPPWLAVIEPSSPFDDDLLALGDGELQAITLAVALKADLLLCDDKGARRAAQEKGVRVVGTLGVLQDAANNGLLELAESLAKLRATNFRVSQALVDQILNDHQ